MKMNAIVGAFILILCFQSYAEEQDTISFRLWDKNYDRPQTLAFIKLAIEKAEPQYGKITIERVVVDTLTEATNALLNDQTIDAFVSGTDSEKEAELLPIFIPLERGLLGFRACMIRPDNQPLFNQIQQAHQFKENQLYIGLGSAWPDRNIMLDNGFIIKHANNRPQLIRMLSENNMQCFSRSMMEIDDELMANQEFGAEKRLAFIYPFADILYMRKRAHKLHEALEYGLQRAIQDRSYFDLFDHHYGNALQKYEFYFRKILILENKRISPKAREAINRYGIASFSAGPRK
jgi:hypothetical protein